jgi:hypothetical protein
VLGSECGRCDVRFIRSVSGGVITLVVPETRRRRAAKRTFRNVCPDVDLPFLYIRLLSGMESHGFNSFEVSLVSDSVTGQTPGRNLTLVLYSSLDALKGGISTRAKFISF